MHLTPNETLDYISESSEIKNKKSIKKMLVLAILAGMAIGFGAMGSTLAAGDFYKTNYGLAKFIAGVVFPVGLIFVILCRLELFTSNCLIVVGAIKKKITLSNMFRILAIVWIGNLIGALIVSFITYKTGTLSPAAQKFLFSANYARVSASAIDIFLKSIMANVIVAACAVSAYAAKDWSGKMLACWFFIMLFTILGYDHSIANMTYIPTSMMMGANISIAQAFYNIGIATVGNFVGGIIIGISFYYVNKK